MSPDELPRIAHDPATFEVFYREHFDAVLRFVVRRVADPHLAADLTAEVFIAAIDAAPSYRAGRGVPRAWLFGIARNLVSSELRRAARERRAQGQIQGRRLLEPDDIARLQERIDAEARSRELHGALSELPEGERAVFELVAAATAAVALVATGSDVTPSAYAVQPRADGSVTVAIRGLEDAAGLERSLRAAGVPAVVDYAAAGHAGCVTPPPHPSGPTPQGTRGTGRRDDGPSLSGRGPTPGGRGMTVQVRLSDDGVKFTIDPGSLKSGEKVYITTSTGALSSIGMAIAKEKPAAPCR